MHGSIAVFGSLLAACAVAKGMSCRQRRRGSARVHRVRSAGPRRFARAWRLRPRNDRRSQRIETEAAFILGAVAQQPQHD